MLEFNNFIAEENVWAPQHPLEQNLVRSLPDLRIMTSQEEIWEKQRRDRIPGIIKRIIPLNPFSFWEYWWAVPGRILLPEDVELLKSDRLRIETILSKLIWSMGGHCFNDHSCFYGDNTPTYDWQKVLDCISSSGLKPEVLDIDFLPTAIAEVKLSHPQEHPRIISPPSNETANYVAIAPGHWHIEFFELQPIEGGFILQEPKPLCSCQIWTGTPFIKHLQTGETMTRYDLSFSSPHDIYYPSWLSGLAAETAD